MKDKEILTTRLSTTCVVNTDFSFNFFVSNYNIHQNNTHTFKMRHIRHLCHRIFVIVPSTCVFYYKRTFGSRINWMLQI